MKNIYDILIAIISVVAIILSILSLTKSEKFGDCWSEYNCGQYTSSKDINDCMAAASSSGCNPPSPSPSPSSVPPEELTGEGGMVGM